MSSKNPSIVESSNVENETSSEAEESETSDTTYFSSEVDSAVCRVSCEPVNQPIDFRLFIRKKFELNDNSDLKIHIGENVFAYQRSILELHSEYFRKLRPLRKVVKLPQEYVTTDALMIIHEWMFNNYAKLPRESILQVFVAADYLQMKELMNHIWSYLNDPLIAEDRAFSLYLEAIYYKLPKVQSAMIMRVRRFFLTLVGFVQFVNLPFGHVCEILASDELGVNCELEVFFACVRYLNSNWAERKDRVFEMLRNVRFGLLPPPVLVSFRFKKEAPDINRLLQDVKVEKLLCQTMHFSIGLGTAPEGCQMFKERKWIYDIDCDYHSTPSQAGKIRLTYEIFREYVHFLAQSETHWEEFASIEDIENAMKLRTVQAKKNKVTGQ